MYLTRVSDRFRWVERDPFMKFKFWKMHGAQNDFVLMDDRKKKFPVEDAAFIRYLTDRHAGIGAEGLILLQPSFDGDFFMPGYQEEGWGIRVNGKNYNNNSTIISPEILGGLSNYQASQTSKTVTWKGTVEGLEIQQTYRIYNAGIAIIFDVVLKNTTSSDMADIYYMRSFYPYNNA